MDHLYIQKPSRLDFLSFTRCLLGSIYRYNLLEYKLSKHPGLKRVIAGHLNEEFE